MSQKKVDYYEEQKANRSKIIKKEKEWKRRKKDRTEKKRPDCIF